PALSGELSVRERLALDFLETLATDHFSIGDETYRRLAEHFTTAEIVELGVTCARVIGIHRFIHTLNVFGDTDPVIHYDPKQVGRSWAQVHGEEVRPTAEADL